MKVKQIFKWIWQNTWSSLAVAYGILMVIAITLVWVTVSYSGMSTGRSSVGFYATTTIFSLVIGIIMFASSLRFGGSNGVSRKSVFLGFLAWAGSACVVMTVINAVLGFLTGILMEDGYFNELYIIVLALNQNHYSAPAEWLLMFTSLLTVLTFGYLLGGGFYRSNKFGKVLIAAGVPISIGVLLPFLFTIFPRAVIQSLSEIFEKVRQFLMLSPYILSGCLLVISAVFAGSGWLLIRRAPITPVENP